MGSDDMDLRIDEEIDSAEEEVDGTHTTTACNKKGEVPKRILKAERERFKREKSNKLFDKLAGVLELNEQNTGKACILREAIKLVNDMLADIHGFRQDNAALLSESQYLTAERNELKDENSALESQIKNIQTEIEERISQSRPDLNQMPPECWEPGPTSNFSGLQPSFQAVDLDPNFQQPPFMGPFYVVAAAPDLQAYSEHEMVVANPPLTVSKPSARHPTFADTWTLQLLEK